MGRSGSGAYVGWFDVMIVRPIVSVLAVAALLLALRSAAEAPLSVVATGDLVFGRFVAGAGGTVTVSANGSAVASGAVFVPASSVVAPATFAVSGEPDFVFALTLPADQQVTLTSNGASMALSDFTSAGGTTRQLNALGVQNLSIGATLNVASGQSAGAYSGAFSIMVEYN